MRASAFMARETYARLRRRIAEIEGRPAGLGEAPGEAPPAPPSLSGSAVRFESRE